MMGHPRVIAFFRAVRRRRLHWILLGLGALAGATIKPLVEDYVRHRYGPSFTVWMDAHVPSASALLGVVVWALRYWWVALGVFGVWLVWSTIRASRGPTTFAYLGLCWHIGEPFWNAYATVDHPDDYELDRYIIGPMCPRCGWSLRREVNTPEGPMLVLWHQCFGCGRVLDPPSLYGLDYHENKRLAYNEAQALVRHERSIPPCPRIKRGV